MRKAREPNDKLDRATDRTLAEADRKALHGWPHNNAKETSRLDSFTKCLSKVISILIRAYSSKINYVGQN